VQNSIAPLRQKDEEGIIMHLTSLLLLLGAAAAVAILHSILPDHWVPLAVVGRTQRWSLLRVARISALASVGHVITSLILGGAIALVGLQFQRQLDMQQGHIIGIVLAITGVGFLLWGLLGNGHGHNHSDGHAHSHHEQAYDHSATHNHTEAHVHSHDYTKTHIHDHDQATNSVATQQTLAKKLSAIVVPFGVAASPDLTILPVALAASAIGGSAVAGVLSVFAILTIGTFVGLTVIATIIGYQIKGAWLENNATTITSLVLIALGIVAFVGL
jgi:ABC-type nickel/cobalt efflux system permease component RcnA